MLRIRKAGDRGHADHGWLNTYHTFSFAGYYDPDHMGFRSLRVLNEDRVKPGKGFGSHPHNDMEIISYVLEGQLEHKDSTGTGSVVEAGQLQIMSAGSGIVHSEFNPSPTQTVHFLQIWITPSEVGLKPGYAQKAFDDETRNALHLVASGDGRQQSMVVHQDVDLYLGQLGAGVGVAHRFAVNRHGWVQVIKGTVTVSGQTIETSDGVAISDEREVDIQAQQPAEVMLFDLS